MTRRPTPGRIRVLVVDDDAEDRLLIRRMLSQAESVRFETECAASLREAIDRLGSWQADVVLLDLGLPDSHGLDTSRTLHAEIPDVPIVVLTGMQDETVGLEAVHLGAQDYLVKGKADGALLVHAVRYAIERQELETALTHALQKLDREFELMAEVQRSLLPPAAPQLQGYEVACTYNASYQAGGDYFDFFPRPDGSMGILVADVSGHGAAAALIMGMTRVLARAVCDEGPPGTCLADLNDRLWEHIPRAKFATACFGILDGAASVFRYADAAHPPPLHLSGEDRRCDHATLRERTPLGVVPGVDYPEVHLPLVAGSVVLLYTDGLTEARNSEGEEFERALVARALEALPVAAGAKDVMAAVLKARAEFCSPEDVEDDTTLVVIRKCGEDETITESGESRE